MIKVDVRKSDGIKFETVLKQMLSCLDCKPLMHLRWSANNAVSVFLKLQERCPLKYLIVRNAPSLSPSKMVRNRRINTEI